MREYAKVSPQFWIGSTGKEMKKFGIETQFTALYLITCPHANMLGIFYIPIMFIAHETGITLEGALQALRNLCEVGFCSYDEKMEYVWVHEMALYQIGGPLKPNDNRVRNVNDNFKNLPNLSFLPRFFEKYKDHFLLDNPPKNFCLSEAPLKPLLSQEQEQEQEKEQEQKKIILSGKPDGDLLKQYKSQEDDDLPKSDKSKTEDDLSKSYQSKAEDNLQKAYQSKPDDNPPKSYKSQAIEILNFLNEKNGRAYRPVDTNLKLIIARLNSGATFESFFQIIAKKTREWKGNPKMAEYLRPATLFNPTKFEQYIGELIEPEKLGGNVMKTRCQECNQFVYKDGCRCGWKPEKSTSPVESDWRCQYMTGDRPCLLPGTICRKPYGNAPKYCLHHDRILSTPEKAEAVLKEIYDNYDQIMEERKDWRRKLPHNL